MPPVVGKAAIFFHAREYRPPDLPPVHHFCGSYAISLITSGKWGQDRQITLFMLLFKPRSAAIPTFPPHLALGIDDDQRDCVKARIRGSARRTCAGVGVRAARSHGRCVTATSGRASAR